MNGSNPIRKLSIVSAIALMFMATFFAPAAQINSADARQQDKRTPTSKLSVPNSEAIAKSLKTIKRLLKSSYKDKSFAGIQDRAKMLLATGLDSNDQPIDQFVLLKQSLDSAIEIGEVETAFKAFSAIVERFEVNEFNELMRLVKSISTKLQDEQGANDLLMICNGRAKTLVATDNYANAKELVVAMHSIARKGKMASWIDFLKDEEKSIESLAKSHRRIARQLGLLRIEPMDANANQAVGEFYCLVKGDFERGLPYLSIGTQPVLKEIAAKELAKPLSAEDELEIADRWWSFGDSLESAAESKIVQRHAAKFYRKLVNETSGITQKKIQRRLEASAQKHSVALSTEEFETILVQTTWMLTWENGSKVEIKFDANGRFKGKHAKGATYKGTWSLINSESPMVQVKVIFEKSIHKWTPQERFFAVESMNKQTGNLTYGMAVMSK